MQDVIGIISCDGFQVHLGLREDFSSTNPFNSMKGFFALFDIKKKNAINAKSPYLRQHAYNPVDWYEWGDEAFAEARAENKPIFLSIGYHWCPNLTHNNKMGIQEQTRLHGRFN